MRILFSTTAGAGHMGPLLPLARACVSAGHEVRIACPERARESAAAAGLQPLTFSDLDAGARAEFDRGLRGAGPEERNRLMVEELFGRLNAESALPGLLDIFSAFDPQLVVREPFEPASWIAARAKGVPSVMVPCCTWHPMPLVGRLLRSGIETLALEHGVELGAGADQDAQQIVSATPASLEADLVVPAQLRRLAPDPPSPARAPRGGVPKIFVCFGTVAGQIPGMLERVGQAVTEAVAGLDVRCLFATGRGVDHAKLGAIPENVEVTDYAILSEALADASLAICHGGYGTTIGTLAVGVPTLALPLFSLDQWATAGAVARAGAGATLDVPEQSASRLRAEIVSLLGDSRVDARAREIAAEMASHPSAHQTVEQLTGS